MDGQNYVVFHNAADDSYMNTSANFRGCYATAEAVDIYFESPISSAVGPSAYDKITLACTNGEEDRAVEQVASAMGGAKAGGFVVVADDVNSVYAGQDLLSVTSITQATGGSHLRVKKVLADTTLVTGDSGSIVLVNPTATTAITLPTLATSLSGWNCKIMITEDVAGTVGGMGQIVNVNFGSGNVVIGQIGSSSDVAGDFSVANDDFVNFTAAASPGDFIDVFTDGTNWYVSGMCTDAAASDVLFHTAAAA